MREESRGRAASSLWRIGRFTRALYGRQRHFDDLRSVTTLGVRTDRAARAWRASATAGGEGRGTPCSPRPRTTSDGRTVKRRCRGDLAGSL